MAAEMIADRVLEGVDLDDLQMLDLATAAAFAGITLERATKELPYSEFGPRTRRVTVKDYKAYQAAHRKTPKRAPKPLTVVTDG